MPRGLNAVSLVVVISALFISAAIAVPILAQSAEDEWSAYDLNGNGAIDGKELIQAFVDYDNGVISLGTLHAVGAAHDYEYEGSDATARSHCSQEYVNGKIAAHAAGLIPIEEVYAAIHCFLIGHPPTPPPTPTPTPTPPPPPPPPPPLPPPDRVPQFKHDSRTYTGVFGTELSVTLDTAAGGDGPLRYSLANGSKPDGSDTDGSLDPNTRVLTISPDAFGDWVYTLTARDTDGDTDTQSVTVTVSEPNFDVTVNNRQGREGAPGNWRSWTVPERWYVFVSITETTVDRALFEFRLVVNSPGQDTGFHVVEPRRHCASSDSHKEPASPWRVGDPTVDGQTTKLYVLVVRCTLGHDGNGAMTVEGRPKAEALQHATFVAHTVSSIEAAGHIASIPATYSDFVKPRGVSPHGLTEDHDFMEGAITKAVEGWHEYRSGLFKPAEDGEDPDINYKGGWWTKGCSGDASACAFLTFDEEDSHTRSGGSIVINYPATDSISWTTDFDVASDLENSAYWLPQAIMHELGHMLGIGHVPSGPRTTSIMKGITLGHPIEGLRQRDKDALDAVLAVDHE